MTAVTSAVLLAAGRGARLGDLTRETPKPLLEIGGRPLLVRILGALSAAGVVSAIVVTGYRADDIEEALGRAALPIELRFVRQTELSGTGRALQLARPLLGTGPFAFAWGDIAVAASNYARLLAVSEGELAIAVNAVDDPAEGAAVYVDEAGLVRRIVEKPPPGTSMTGWNNAGFGVLDDRIWPAIEALQPSARGEYELPRAIAALVDQGVPVRAVAVEGPWFDIGTPVNLSAAREAADNGSI